MGHRTDGDGNGGTGSYQIKVRVNNVCFIRDGKPFYDWDGGPDGYSDDLAADTSTRQTLSAGRFPASNIGAFLGDNWDEDPDDDWFAIELTQGYEYTVEVWANPYVSEEHQATKLKILGIYDSSGTALGGTASSGGRIRASVDFQPNSTGRYYIAVGSQGQDRTGLYRISVTEAAITTRDANNPRKEVKSVTRTPSSENSPASGLPSIVGLAKVGGTLTTETSEISDADGLKGIEFSYQWISNDGQDDRQVEGVTGSSYTPVEADVGTTLKVLVSFIDNAGNSEELTSAPTSPVAGLPAVSVSFGQATYTVGEGNSVTVALALSADPERSVTILLTAAGQDGADGDDYSVPTSVTFASGEMEQAATFTATQDTINDDGESVKLDFGTLPTDVSEGSTAETTVSITDDDVPAVSVSFEQGTYTVGEGNSVTVALALSADPERSVTILLTAVGRDGADGDDYSVPTSVTFASGEMEQAATFTATQDTINDDGESVKLGLGTLPTDVSEGSTAETTVSITDDDVPAVSVSFEQGTYTVDEGKTVTVKVTLSADPERTVAIPITKTGQAGASNSDYSGVPTSVTLASGETEKAITFSAATDNDNDDGESVKLTFGTLPAGVTAGSTAEATVSIIDDLEEAVEPPPAPQNLSVTANSDGSITLTWDAPDDDSVTGYQILRRRPAMGEDNLIVYVENTGSTATSFIDRDVTAGTRHTYRVKAINEAGPGPRSNYDRVNP